MHRRTTSQHGGRYLHRKARNWKNPTKKWKRNELGKANAASRSSERRSWQSLHHLTIAWSRARELLSSGSSTFHRRSVTDFYAFCEEGSLNLANLKLQPALSLCRQLRTEALPIFFAVNTFSTSLRSNWCVKHHHFHDPRHGCHDEIGYAELSPLLSESDGAIHGMVSLPDQIIRLRRLQLRINCCRCDDAKEIGSLDLYIEGHKAFVGTAATSTIKTPTIISLGIMFMKVKMLVEQMGKREIFNGFTVQDIRDVAWCFRQNVVFPT